MCAAAADFVSKSIEHSTQRFSHPSALPRWSLSRCNAGERKCAHVYLSIKWQILRIALREAPHHVAPPLQYNLALLATILYKLLYRNKNKVDYS